MNRGTTMTKFSLKKPGHSQINVDHNIFVIPVGINKGIISTFIDDMKVIEVKRLGYI